MLNSACKVKLDISERQNCRELGTFRARNGGFAGPWTHLHGCRCFEQCRFQHPTKPPSPTPPYLPYTPPHHLCCVKKLRRSRNLRVNHFPGDLYAQWRYRTVYIFNPKHQKVSWALPVTIHMVFNLSNNKIKNSCSHLTWCVIKVLWRMKSIPLLRYSVPPSCPPH